MALRFNKMAIIQEIQTAKAQSRKLLVLLIDPEKQDSMEALRSYLALPDMIFVGGSTGNLADSCIADLRKFTECPIVLFPGNISQFSPKADALLFLSVLNAKTADMLITPHIEVAKRVIDSGIESIAMGYILIDGGRKSSVEIVSNCVPISQDAVDHVVATALAGQLLGKQLIYLEAGSGAKNSVSIEIIRAVSEQLRVPLIVGGGICTPEAMMAVYEAGADIVVIGNHFEQHPDEISDFIRIKREKYGK